MRKLNTLSWVSGVQNCSMNIEQCFSVAPDILHPVVRTHPVSGRRSIYISDNFLERFDQMTVSVVWCRSAGKSKRKYVDRFNSIAGWRKHPSQTIPHLMGKIVSYILYCMHLAQSKTIQKEMLTSYFSLWPTKVSRAEHVYRHQWKEGDLVMWDNRWSTQYFLCYVYIYGYVGVMFMVMRDNRWSTRCFLLCYVMLCYVMLCFAMLCYVGQQVINAMLFRFHPNFT